MVNPPEADPVIAANKLVETASETSGPPSIDKTQSRTTANAGTAATTAPKPTRLATLTTGSTEALAPASMVSRNNGSRRWSSSKMVAMPTQSAIITDQTPLTDENAIAPHR